MTNLQAIVQAKMKVWESTTLTLKQKLNYVSALNEAVLNPGLVQQALLQINEGKTETIGAGTFDWLAFIQAILAAVTPLLGPVWGPILSELESFLVQIFNPTPAT